MRLALINPPYSLAGRGGGRRNHSDFPLGLAYLAAYLRRGGHTAVIFDPDPAGQTLAGMWESLAAFKPDVVGLTCVTNSFMAARTLAAEAKKKLGCAVLMGGAHATALPRSTLEGTTGLDAVILGEGEVPALALADAFDKAGKLDLGAVPGAAFMQDGVYRENPRPEPIADLDSLPPPARDLVNLPLYGAPAGPRRALREVTVLSSRGCPSACTFCANICMGRRFRPRSPQNFVAELESLKKEFSVKHFRIVDDCFTADPKRLSAICDLMLERRLNCTWDAAGRVNNLQDEGLIRKMKRSGCRHILLGIESGSQEILDRMCKGITPEVAMECCAKLRKADVSYVNSFILGAEGETRATVAASVALAIKLKAYLTAFLPLIPYPGTPVFEKYYKDYDRPDTDWTDWCSSGPERPYEPRQTGLSWKELRRLRNRAYLRYYLDPMQFLRIMDYVFKL